MSLLTDSQAIKLSKSLSRALRHDAVKMGLNIGSDGRVALTELLNNRAFRGYSVADVEKVVEENNKKRFEISVVDGVQTIRAAQGHTLKCIDDEELLTEVLDPSEIPVCVHGTYHQAMPMILASGLNRMKRNHIHMAVGVPGDDFVISGMRSSCQVTIFVDVARAMAAGVRFFGSSNGVILTKGINDSGVLPVDFFLRVEDRK